MKVVEETKLVLDDDLRFDTIKESSIHDSSVDFYFCMFLEIFIAPDKLALLSCLIVNLVMCRAVITYFISIIDRSFSIGCYFLCFCFIKCYIIQDMDNHDISLFFVLSVKLPSLQFGIQNFPSITLAAIQS